MHAPNAIDIHVSPLDSVAKSLGLVSNVYLGFKAQPLLASPEVDTQDSLVLTHNFQSLMPGERYTFAVAAYNDIGEGPQSLTTEVIAATVPA